MASLKPSVLGDKVWGVGFFFYSALLFSSGWSSLLVITDLTLQTSGLPCIFTHKERPIYQLNKRAGVFQGEMRKRDISRSVPPLPY